ncbi:MAG: hypothetical protein BWY76_01664 [bacterium ADurb.Bin429]|nr:MAG: hypothetical protein BWY76_01664 [bacterium ADurb.Bin429]
MPFKYALPHGTPNLPDIVGAGSPLPPLRGEGRLMRKYDGMERLIRYTAQASFPGMG